MPPFSRQLSPVSLQHSGSSRSGKLSGMVDLGAGCISRHLPGYSLFLKDLCGPWFICCPPHDGSPNDERNICFLVFCPGANVASSRDECTYAYNVKCSFNVCYRDI